MENIIFLTDYANSEKYKDLVFPSILRIYVSLPAFTYPDIKRRFSKTLLSVSCPWIIEESQKPLNLELEFGFDIKATTQTKIRSSIESQEKPNFPNQKDIDSTLDIFYPMLINYICDKSIPHARLSEFICFFETLVIQKPINEVFNLINNNTLYSKEMKLDFSYAFSKLVTLMVLAHKNNCEITPYIYALRNIYEYIVETGLKTLEENKLDPVTLSRNELKNEDDIANLPNSIIDIVHCFSEADALVLFEILCDYSTINSDKDIVFPTLDMIYDTTKWISEKTKYKMYTLVTKLYLMYPPNSANYQALSDFLKKIKPNHLFP